MFVWVTTGVKKCDIISAKCYWEGMGTRKENLYMVKGTYMYTRRNWVSDPMNRPNNQWEPNQVKKYKITRRKENFTIFGLIPQQHTLRRTIAQDQALVTVNFNKWNDVEAESLTKWNDHEIANLWWQRHRTCKYMWDVDHSPEIEDCAVQCLDPFVL